MVPDSHKPRELTGDHLWVSDGKRFSPGTDGDLNEFPAHSSLLVWHFRKSGHGIKLHSSWSDVLVASLLVFREAKFLIICWELPKSLFSCGILICVMKDGKLKAGSKTCQMLSELIHRLFLAFVILEWLCCENMKKPGPCWLQGSKLKAQWHGNETK